MSDYVPLNKVFSDYLTDCSELFVEQTRQMERNHSRNEKQIIHRTQLNVRLFARIVSNMLDAM